MKKLKYDWFVLLLVLISTFSLSSAKTKKVYATDNAIKWSSIEQSMASTKIDNKKFIFIDLYTDWCGWCKKMDENVYQDAGIISALNESFTTVKFNAEITSPVSFNGKTYTFTKTGARGANQLALDLGSVGGKLGYPTIIILDANGNKLQAFPGYKDVETLSVILKYYNSGSYTKMDFQQFQSGQ